METPPAPPQVARNKNRPRVKGGELDFLYMFHQGFRVIARRFSHFTPDYHHPEDRFPLFFRLHRIVCKVNHPQIIYAVLENQVWKTASRNRRNHFDSLLEFPVQADECFSRFDLKEQSLSEIFGSPSTELAPGTKPDCHKGAEQRERDNHLHQCETILVEKKRAFFPSLEWFLHLQYN